MPQKLDKHLKLSVHVTYYLTTTYIIQIFSASNQKMAFLTIPIFQFPVSDQQHFSTTATISIHLRENLQVYCFVQLFYPLQCKHQHCFFSHSITAIMFLLSKFPDLVYAHIKQSQFPQQLSRKGTTHLRTFSRCKMTSHSLQAFASIMLILYR